MDVISFFAFFNTAISLVLSLARVCDFSGGGHKARTETAVSDGRGSAKNRKQKRKGDVDQLKISAEFGLIDSRDC
jgi:hypothetical protein